MILVWSGFIAFVILMLWIDLGVLNRGNREPTVRHAMAMTALCVTLSLAFAGVIYFLYANQWMGVGVHTYDGDAPLSGRQAALKYLTGWVVEYALSLDNIFVISVIFTHFRVPKAFQHRVLFWGILGALVFRGLLIGVGAALIHEFHWMIYVFGALLIATALKMLFSKSDGVEIERNLAVRFAVRLFPFTREYHGERFFVRDDGGRRLATPMLLVLLVVETTDIVFAVDSIPAIFAVTKDPFLVFTSNVFAILGLRSLYFALAAVIDTFRYLKISLVVVLLYVGVKMLVSEVWPIPPAASLGVIAGVLLAGILASVARVRWERAHGVVHDHHAAPHAAQDEAPHAGPGDTAARAGENQAP